MGVGLLFRRKKKPQRRNRNEFEEIMGLGVTGTKPINKEDIEDHIIDMGLYNQKTEKERKSKKPSDDNKGKMKWAKKQKRSKAYRKSKGITRKKQKSSSSYIRKNLGSVDTSTVSSSLITKKQEITTAGKQTALTQKYS